MATLRLRLRTPRALLLDTDVSSVTAEDVGGWFGLRPGRTDVVAALVPGMLLFEDAEGEGFVALAGGLLDLRAGECRVMAREAVVARDLDNIADALEAQLAARDQRAEVRSDVIDDLAKEALRRLVEEFRS
jgi:F-type H+-transporting ATPase subunit epsilon